MSAPSELLRGGKAQPFDMVMLTEQASESSHLLDQVTAAAAQNAVARQQLHLQLDQTNKHSDELARRLRRIEESNARLKQYAMALAVGGALIAAIILANKYI